jgi:3-dehydroquinate dehydratase-2
MNLSIINGPNLNLLGVREPEVYGSESFDNILEQLKQSFPNITFSYFQSNIEGELIDEIQQKGFKSDGIILNAGGYTHTSVAIADAVAAIKTPVIEVHISNIFARELVRAQSLISEKCLGMITGLGPDVYYLAVNYFEKNIKV